MGSSRPGSIKIDRSLRIRDRQWQPSIIRLIKQMRVL